MATETARQSASFPDAGAAHFGVVSSSWSSSWAWSLSSCRHGCTTALQLATPGNDIGSLPKSIGVDYGLVRTGVAVSMGYCPEPLKIIRLPKSARATVQTKKPRKPWETHSLSQRRKNNDEDEAAAAAAFQAAQAMAAMRAAPDVARQVVDLCAAEMAQAIVVGLPLHKNGTDSAQSLLTRRFAAELACQVHQRWGPNSVVKVYLWDERYTSKEAAARWNVENGGESSSQNYLDATAASVLLEDYYFENFKGGVSLPPPVTVPASRWAVCEAKWQEHCQTLRKEATQRRQDFEREKEAMAQRKAQALAEVSPTISRRDQKLQFKKQRRAKRAAKDLSWAQQVLLQQELEAQALAREEESRGGGEGGGGL